MGLTPMAIGFVSAGGVVGLCLLYCSFRVTRKGSVLKLELRVEGLLRDFFKPLWSSLPPSRDSWMAPWRGDGWMAVPGGLAAAPEAEPSLTNALLAEHRVRDTAPLSTAPNPASRTSQQQLGWHQGSPIQDISDPPVDISDVGVIEDDEDDDEGLRVDAWPGSVSDPTRTRRKELGPTRAPLPPQFMPLAKPLGAADEADEATQARNESMSNTEGAAISNLPAAEPETRDHTTPQGPRVWHPSPGSAHSATLSGEDLRRQRLGRRGERRMHRGAGDSSGPLSPPVSDPDSSDVHQRSCSPFCAPQLARRTNFPRSWRMISPRYRQTAERRSLASSAAVRTSSSAS